MVTPFQVEGICVRYFKTDGRKPDTFLVQLWDEETKAFDDSQVAFKVFPSDDQWHKIFVEGHVEGDNLVDRQVAAQVTTMKPYNDQPQYKLWSIKEIEGKANAPVRNNAATTIASDYNTRMLKYVLFKGAIELLASGQYTSSEEVTEITLRISGLLDTALSSATVPEMETDDLAVLTAD